MKLFDQLTAGVAYYPEHWDESLWEGDLLRMKAHGITMVRIGDFAWSKYEFREGEFTMDIFDRFLDLCEKHEMKVIFCTPTAAPPVWMSHKYPEILNRSIEGDAYTGPRRHYNYNSEIYRRFCARLVEKLAAHYAPRKGIVAWQIDNELNCDLKMFYSDADHQAYRTYLQRKYQTLERVNEALGLTFWSREYSEWEQVQLVGKNVGGAINPQQALEERRFFSESAISFCKMQTKILRRYLSSDVMLTTNGLFGNLDYNRLMEEGRLDFLTYDSYPNFANERARTTYEGDLKDRKWSWSMAWTRSASPIFGIMEQQAGANGWSSRMETPSPMPGQMRLWAMQSAAHGADLVAFFRWRTSPMGCEIYWHGLNDYNNAPNQRLLELKRFTQDYAKLSGIKGGCYHARIAVVKDYVNDWDADADIWHGRIDRQSDDAWFRASQHTHTPCDFLFLNETTKTEELQRYAVLVYPHPAIMTEKISDLLKRYVEYGGCLIMGARVGYKDETGRCPMRALPGCMSEWCGFETADCFFLHPENEAPCYHLGDVSLQASHVLEEIRGLSDDVQVLSKAPNASGNLHPILVEKRLGQGKLIYLASCFTEQSAEMLLAYTGEISPYQELFSLPKETELAVRICGDTKYLFMLNYHAHSVQVELHREMKELLSGENKVGMVTVPGYGVQVYEWRK